MPKKANPVNKRGDRNYKCDRHAECLTYAARQDWRYMSCEACPYFKKGQKQKPRKSQVENKRICEKCGEKPTIHPNSPYCSGCMHKMKLEKAAKPSKKKNEATSTPKAGRPQETANTAVTIDFTEYASILKEVEALAKKEMRPLGMQIAYILKKYLENVGGTNERQTEAG